MTNPFSAVNHVGVVVSDLDAGLAFFIDVLGFEAIVGRSGNLSPLNDIQTRRFGVHPEASGRYAFVRLGDSVIELLQWDAPDQNRTAPLNSDLGGRHLAINVSNMPAALDRLRQIAGVSVREPNDAGFVYCATPLGLEIQLIPVS